LNFPEEKNAMPKFEYKIVVRSCHDGKFEWFLDKNDKRNAEELLNALGNEGWEFVSATPLALRAGNGDSTLIHYFLKRQLT